jgi:hypothetical protein
MKSLIHAAKPEMPMPATTTTSSSRFILDHMPVGVIGLLMAVMFCASMSTTSAELNALASTTTVDVIRRDWSESGRCAPPNGRPIAYGGLAMSVRRRRPRISATSSRR